MKNSHKWTRRLAVILLGGVIGCYLALTPAGLLDKADVVGYAVCHRITSHSFLIGGRQLPLCARCTGTYLGALVGLVGQVWILRRRRESEFPPLPTLLLLIGFIALMGFDGLNSYLNMIPGAPYLYQPQQWLRLVTGLLNGLALSAILLPMVNYSLWRDPTPRRVIQGWRDLVVLLALVGGAAGLVLVGWPLLLVPLALASAAGILIMLTMIYTIIVVMVTGRENCYSSWREALTPLTVGMALAVLMVGLIALVRYALTGTFVGFPGLG
jgi:uncharacterized membrane protein